MLGPNPGAGVRFFGIGNELEAILTTLTLIGTGAWLEIRRAGLERRRAAIWFVGVAVVATAAFAPGRFGADVGAAIVLGVGVRDRGGDRARPATAARDRWSSPVAARWRWRRCSASTSYWAGRT